MKLLQAMSIIKENVTKYHYLAVHPGTFRRKEDFQLALVTHWFKKKGFSKPYSLQEIFEMTANGKVFIPSHIETDGDEYSFISSSLMALDIDDDEKLTDPRKVLEELKEVCAGLFFTSSHSETKNRYRLVFALDETIHDEYIYKSVFKQLCNRLALLNIPVDENASSPLQRIRTAMKGYIINDLNAKLPVRQLIDQAKSEKQKEVQQKLNELHEKSKVLIYSFEELKERAKTIGYVEGFEDWQKLGYSLKSYVHEGHLTDQEGYEIFEILCGGNDESTFWDSLKANRITIGTFIYYSNQKGFKRSFKYYHAISNMKSPLPVEVKKFEKYIPVEFSKEMLKAEEKILIKSPTGSGKTSSLIRAAKELAEEHTANGQTRFFIFSVPTIAITDQVAHDHKILSVRGQTLNLYQQIKEYINDGGRVITCTYDMTLILHELLQSIKPFASYSLMVDEVHQLTHNYNFRTRAIESLMTMQKYAKSFIGLTGTEEDVLRDMFDKEIHVTTKYEKAPCQMWGALIFEKKEEEEPLLYQLIKQKADSGKRLLVFIQNKDVIKRLQIQLKKAKIKVAIVASDGKLTNSTYKTLVQQSIFPNDVQVILSTSVLSDGININNENSKYDCILVATQNSQMFNVAQARQCANRFRNTYEGFYIFMQQPKKTTEYLFHIESAYHYEKLLAQNTIDLINTEFSGHGNYQLLRLATIEKRYGLHYSEGMEDVKFNRLKLRYNVSQEKSQFYALYRGQFIKALTHLMMCNPAPAISVSEYIKNSQIDLTEVANELTALKESSQLEKEQKQANIRNVFTETIYQAFKLENEEVLNTFKNATTSEHYSCLANLVPIADYETCLKVVSKVERRADINKFKNHIEALTNIQYFNKVRRQTATREVFKELSLHLGKKLTKDEITDITKQISKRFKRSKKVDVEFVLNNYFYQEKKRLTGGKRLTILHELTIEHVSEIHEIHIEKIKNSMLLYAEKQGGEVSKVIVKSSDVY